MNEIRIRFGIAVFALVLGPLNVYGASGDVFVSVDRVSSSGGGALYQYDPDGVRTVFASDLSKPRGLGFDSLGNLFVATTSCQGERCQTTLPMVVKITPEGTSSVFATMPGSFFAEGLAIDRSDNVFVVVFHPFKQSTIYKFAPDGKGRPFGFLDQQASESFDLAFGSTGDLFAVVAEIPPFGGGDILKFAPDGTRTLFASGIGDPALVFSGPEFLIVRP